MPRCLSNLAAVLVRLISHSRQVAWIIFFRKRRIFLVADIADNSPLCCNESVWVFYSPVCNDGSLTKSGWPAVSIDMTQSICLKESQVGDC